MRDPPADDDDAHDLVRAGMAQLPAGSEALAHVIAQSNREAAANRAQARELIKALDGVQRSQEYLGTALREERSRTRWLSLLVLLVPIAVGVGVWYASGRMDDVRTDLTDRLGRVAADAETARAQDAAKYHDSRLSELASDLDGLHRDLDASRDALAAERRHLAAREAALATAQSRNEEVRGEIGALEFETKVARAKAGAEQARASHLENRIRELEAELKSRSKPVAPPRTPATAEFAAVAPPSPAAPADAAPRPAPAVPAAAPAAVPSSADAAETERSRRVLNGLLAETTDAVRYQFASIGGLAGRTLSGVRLVGSDSSGAIVRTIEAERVEVTLDAATGSVVIRCIGGKLIMGTIEAPFFGGSYGLVVRGDAARWKRSGLACVE